MIARVFLLFFDVAPGRPSESPSLVNDLLFLAVIVIVISGSAAVIYFLLMWKWLTRTKPAKSDVDGSIRGREGQPHNPNQP
jgi:hypothetical protein